MKSGWLLLALAVVAVAACACRSQQSAEAKNPPTLTPSAPGVVTIAKVTMYRDDGSGHPGDEVTVFKPADRVMHFAASARGLEFGQKILLIFTAVDASGKVTHIANADGGAVLAANQITGQISLPTDWPVGLYRMDIYVNGDRVYVWSYRVER